MKKNLKVSLYWYCKTTNGWQRFPVELGKGGRYKTGYVVVDGVEHHYPNGTYNLRSLVDGKTVWRNVGANAIAAQAALQNEQRVRRLKVESVGTSATVVVSEGSKPLSVKRDEFMQRVTLTNGRVGVSIYRLSIDGFLAVVRKSFASEIVPEDLLLYARSQQHRGFSDRTIHNRAGRILAFLRYAGVTEAQLPEKRERPKAKLKAVKYYDQSELDEFFAKCPPEHALVWEFLAKTGLRERECANLQFSDLNFERRTLKIINKPEIGFRIKTKEERVVPLESGLLDKLKAHAAANAGRSFIFGTRNDHPDKQLLLKLKQSVEAAGMNCGECAGCRKNNQCSNWFLHKFRATFATLCLHRGMDLRTLMTLMGHHNLQSTMRYLAPASSSTMKTQIDSIFGARDESKVVTMPKRQAS